MVALGSTLKIEIVWPGGAKQTVENVKANQFVTIREGKGIVASDPIRFGGTGGSISRPKGTDF